MPASDKDLSCGGVPVQRNQLTVSDNRFRFRRQMPHITPKNQRGLKQRPQRKMGPVFCVTASLLTVFLVSDAIHSDHQHIHIVKASPAARRQEGELSLRQLFDTSP